MCLLLCSTALVYGLVCLAVAYLASLMGSVLQVTVCAELHSY